MAERSVGITWDASSLQHNAGAGHPERPERLMAIRERLHDEKLWSDLTPIEVREATATELERAHSTAHVSEVLKTRGRSHFFDGDTQSSSETVEAALLTAGGAIALAEAVVTRQVERGFGLGRPPGHHAEKDRVMGFCYFNHIAVVAHALLERDDIEKVMIVDWDVHHGNGTQDIFWDDPRVMFLSLHQSPHYPGTGRIDEIGGAGAEGTTVNVPLSGGALDDDYLYCFEQIVAPLGRAFAPDVLLISAGYDAHRRDMLGGMNVTDKGFAAMATSLCRLAEGCCGGRVVAFLEGGYDLEGLAGGVYETFKVMLGEEAPMNFAPTAIQPQTQQAVQRLKTILAPHWSL